MRRGERNGTQMQLHLSNNNHHNNHNNNHLPHFTEVLHKWESIWGQEHFKVGYYMSWLNPVNQSKGYHFRVFKYYLTLLLLELSVRHVCQFSQRLQVTTSTKYVGCVHMQPLEGKYSFQTRGYYNDWD